MDMFLSLLKSALPGSEASEKKKSTKILDYVVNAVL